MDHSPAIVASFKLAAAESKSSVIGPYGEVFTRDMLPPSNVRWTARRKAEVVAVVHGGMLTMDEACAMYKITTEEYDLWERAIGRAGLSGLRVTKIQEYRKIMSRDW